MEDGWRLTRLSMLVPGTARRPTTQVTNGPEYPRRHCFT